MTSNGNELPQITQNMQRWFFLEDANNEGLRLGKGDASIKGASLEYLAFTTRNWLFRVRVKALTKDESVCVVGDLKELGNWIPEQAVLLNQEHEDSEIWSGNVEIPDKRVIKFRFFVCIVIESGIQVIVRSWETCLYPRLIDFSAISPTMNTEPLEYGCYNNYEQICRGWLNKETVVQLKLSSNPLTLWRPKYSNRTVFVKVTPINLLRHNLPRTVSESLDESLSADTQDNMESAKFAITEVASLKAEDPSFQPQNQFGDEIKRDDVLIFQSTVLFPQSTAYLLDLYIYSSRGDEGEPPYHAGFSYLLPTVLQSSEGNVVLPVTSTKHRPLGEIRVDYLVIGSLPNFKCDMSLTYIRHWKKTRSGLDVGHRGSGSSFKNKVQNCAEVRENTIASLKNAIDHGADFVEFDVQLSKDLVPIIYHDFHVCISMKRKKELQDQDMLELPVKELTLEQLKMLKVYHVTEGKTKNPRFFDEDLEDHQPFPTLQQALETLNPHVGFNIEIKWTMKMLDGTYELYHPTDLNLYLDTILDVVLRYGEERRIIFSCFNPDICQVIRLKQNKYPVMFLTVGESQHHDRYADPRCWSIRSAVQYATMIEILGINVHTEDILRDASLVKLATQANLVIFCWGDENADPGTIRLMKELGMHGIIYDKIYQYSSKEVKESIFLLKARETQKELMELAANTAESPSSPPEPTRILQSMTPGSQPLKESVLDLDKIRMGLPDNMSTATSLESLESAMSDYDNKANIETKDALTKNKQKS